MLILRTITSIRRGWRMPTLLLLLFLVSSCATIDKQTEMDDGASSMDSALVERRIREFEEYMSLTKSGDYSIDIVLRLAEGYLSAREEIYKREMREYEKKLALYEKGSLASSPKEPLPDYSAIIKQLKPFSSRHKYGRGADSIRYIMGFALYEQGKRDEAAVVFEELLKNYPRSEFAAEVSFRLGEFYFDTGQTREALDSYKNASLFSGSVFYDKSMYKTGWIYYKMEEYDKALDTFVDVANRNWKDGKDLGTFTDEVITCIAMVLSLRQDAEKSVDLVASKGGGAYVQPLLLRLGNMLFENARYAPAHNAYKALLSFSPDGVDVPFIMGRIADIYERMGDADKAMNMRWELILLCNPSGEWYKKRYKDREGDIDGLLSENMTTLSRKYHMRWKDKGDRDGLERAIRLYEMLIASYPKSTSFRESNLLLAEALFDIGNYREAVLRYDGAAALYPDGTERGDAAYSGFLAAEMMFKGLEKSEAVNLGKQLIDHHKNSMTANNTYEKAGLRLADMAEGTGLFALAREALIPLTKGSNPYPVYTKLAFIYLKEGSPAAAEEIYRKMSSGPKDEQYRNDRAQVLIGVAEGYLQERKLKEAYARFIEVFDTNPGYKKGELILLRLATLYIENREFGQMEGLVSRMTKAYPDSANVMFIIDKAGEAMQVADPAAAVSLYERSASLVHITHAPKLIFLAASISETAGSYGKAEELYKKFLQYKGKVPIEREDEAAYRVAELQIKLGKKSEAMKTLEGILSKKTNLNEGIAAKARLLLLKDSHSSYMQIKLTAPFEETFKKKSDAIEVLLAEYTGIVKTKIPEVMPEAFFHMGTALENFRDSVLLSEKPKDLTKEELEEYQFLLEEKAYPYDEEAVKIYEAAVDVGRKQKVFDGYVEESLKRLSEIRPALYERGGKSLAEPVFFDPVPAELREK